MGDQRHSRHPPLAVRLIAVRKVRCIVVNHHAAVGIELDVGEHDRRRHLIHISGQQRRLVTLHRGLEAFDVTHVGSDRRRANKQPHQKQAQESHRSLLHSLSTAVHHTAPVEPRPVVQERTVLSKVYSGTLL